MTHGEKVPPLRHAMRFQRCPYSANLIAGSRHQGNGADIHAVTLQSRLEEIEADDVELILPVIQMGHGNAEGVVLSVTDQA